MIRTLLDFIAQHPDEPEIHNVSHIYEDEPEPPAPDVEKALREVMDCARNSRRRREHLLALDDGRRLLDDYGDKLESTIRAALLAKQAGEQPATQTCSFCDQPWNEVRLCDRHWDEHCVVAKQPEPKGVLVEVKNDYLGACWITAAGFQSHSVGWDQQQLLGITEPGRYRVLPAVRIDKPEPTRAQTLAEASEFCRLHGACDLADAVREMADKDAE